MKDVQRVSAEIYKQRNGPTGRVPIVFMRQYTRFESAAKITDADTEHPTRPTTTDS